MSRWLRIVEWGTAKDDVTQYINADHIRRVYLTKYGKDDDTIAKDGQEPQWLVALEFGNGNHVLAAPYKDAKHTKDQAIAQQLEIMDTLMGGD